jgi:methylmalonyl-CoA mutase cobalamin-binding domain/chain
MANKITSYMSSINEKETLEEVKLALASEQSPMDIIEALRKGITEVGEKYEKGDLFLVHLIMTAEIMKSAMDLIRPSLKETQDHEQTLGTIVLGTVQGDVHDIGKNIFAALMDASGFKVIDLGVNVPPEEFVKAIKTHDTTLVGLSTLITNGVDGIKATIKRIEESGLRKKVRILVGGSIFRGEDIQQSLAADFVTRFASAGVKYALNLEKGSD